jgi:hypothetical protein
MAVPRPIRVEGFDITGRRLFSVVVEAYDKEDAFVLAGEHLKKTARGQHLWSNSTRLKLADHRAPSYA